MNAAIFARLSNAVATIGLATGVAVIYEKNYANLLNMVDSYKPAIHVLDSAIQAGTKKGTAVTLDIDVTPYVVADRQADGEGITILILEKA